MKYAVIVALVVAAAFFGGNDRAGAAPASGLSGLRIAIEDAAPMIEVARRRRCYQRWVRIRGRRWYGPRFCTSRRVVRNRRVRCWRARRGYRCTNMRG